MSSLVTRYVFAGCLCASVVDLLVVDFVVGPRALRPEVARPLVSEPARIPESPPAATTAAPTAGPTASASARIERARSRVVARFESDQQAAHDDELAALAAAMRANPSAEIVLEGHSDRRGDPVRNHALSMERATWAQSRLVELGVSPSRIAVVGLGAERPLDDSDDDAAVSNNRRVEVRWLTGSPEERP